MTSAINLPLEEETTTQYIARAKMSLPQKYGNFPESITNERLLSCFKKRTQIANIGGKSL